MKYKERKEAVSRKNGKDRRYKKGVREIVIYLLLFI
jgi:hypothetical protein